ncbi:MAG: glucuronate isomerase [Clostridia bacterium]|nr:glucuronate isomerase [Clostridia bacterium]
MQQARNLWQLLQKERDRSALMRACGVAEQVLTDGSDYDRFDAYAACMPLCEGHEILQADAQLIEELLGVRVPICPESAPDLWHAAAHALTEQGEVPDAPKRCEIAFASPTNETLCAVDLGQAFYAVPTTELMMRLLDPAVQAISVGVQLERFVKPNPYTARRLCEAARESLTAEERDHLSAQTLRVLGKLCAERGSVLYVESDFAARDAWRALLAYLQQSGCLAQIVLIVRDVDALRAAATLAGCLPNPTDAPTVRVGVASVPAREALLDLYASLLPIGMLPENCFVP